MYLFYLEIQMNFFLKDQSLKYLTVTVSGKVGGGSCFCF